MRKSRWAKQKKKSKFCVYCGTRFTNGGWHARTRDHRVPRALGGGGLSNVVSACRRCNEKKGCKVWEIKFDTTTGKEIFIWKGLNNASDYCKSSASTPSLYFCSGVGGYR